MQARTGARSVFESLEHRQLLSDVKVMPLGDSITQGYNGQQSYRLDLYNLLAKGGYNVDFVGSQTGTYDGQPTYNNLDENNEGHSGWTTDQIESNIQAWAATYKPDIVLLQIGTNDVIRGVPNATAAANVQGIITNLRASVPNVKIVLAQITPENDANGNLVADYNSRLRAIATSMTTANSPISTVDQYTGFDVNADTIDLIHPNATGETLEAANYYKALQSILSAPTAPPPGDYLGDVIPTNAVNGWGNFEQDRSNGEQGPIDGSKITINGVTYMRGIGAHAYSDLTYNIAGKGYTQFNSDIGVDDEETGGGTVDFQVYADGVLKYDSGKVDWTMAAKSISVGIAGASTLDLVVTDGGDGNGQDHGDWANARLYTPDVVVVPVAPSNLNAAASTSTIGLNWSDNASNETGYRVERKTGSTGTYAQIASLSANTVNYTDTAATSGLNYFYRVYAYNSGGNSSYSNESSATIATSTTNSYLSDLAYVPISNGWGPVERDSSNGENAAGDGHTLTLNGKTYSKGLGVHANSEVDFNLGGNYATFSSDIGVDDEVGSSGSVEFLVYLDGLKAFDSGTVTGSSATQTVTLSVAGKQSMKLYVLDAGDGNAFDHADWAGASLTTSTGTLTVPTAPSGAAASATSSTSVLVTWVDNSNNESGFTIQRKTGTGAWADLASVAANVTTYTDSTAAASTTYSYRVYATSSAGNSTTSNEPSTTTPAVTTLPAAPGGTTATATSSTSVLVGWTDNSNNETGFTIQRKTGTGAWGNLATVAANTTTYTDNTAVANTTYSYRVYASNSAGNSATSNEPAVTTPATPVVPTAASSLVATYNSTAGNVALTWVDNSSNETGFRVERKIGTGNYSVLATLGANVTSYTDSALTASTTYIYRVIVFNGVGDGSASNEQSVTTAAGSATSVYVSDLPYNAVSNGWGPIERDTSNGEQAAGDGHTITLNGVTYTKGFGTNANAEIDVPLGGNYAAFTSDIGVDDEVGNYGSVDFQIYLDGVKAYDSGTVTGSSATKTVSLSVSGKQKMQLFITDAGDGNAFDHGDWAGAKLTSGTISAPNAPSGLAANYSTNSVALSWTDNSSNESNFIVQRKAGLAGTWATIATLASNTTNYTDVGPFNASTSYYYQVLASNTAGSSASNSTSITTSATTSVFVSDLSPIEADNAWGPVEKDMSNGEQAAGDGHMITIRGKTYAKGLGTNAYSKLVYNINGAYSTFTTDLGIDDEVGGNGTVNFEIFGDGSLLYSSGTVTGKDVVRTAVVSVSGVQQLWLVVDATPDGNGQDHADWAGATLST